MRDLNPTVYGLFSDGQCMGGGFHPPAISTNFAPIELKFSQDMSNHVRVTNQEKIEKKTKMSRKFRGNMLILRNIM